MPTDLPSDSTSKPLTPEVTWAQRSSSDEASKNFVYLTILASDVSTSDIKLDLQASSVTFSGYSSSKKAQYAVTLDLFAEIDPKESKVHHSARAIEMKLQKKDLKEEYWPRLLKNDKKVHFLKTDFDKWVDEDEQDGVPDDDYMNQFGGGGMPGMGAGMGGDGGFGGLDFSKLGGAGGMPDLSALGGAGGMPDLGGDGSDDDDDMPDMEDEEAADGAQATSGATGASATKTSSKIEEVE